MTEPLHRELDRLDLDLQVAAALLRFEQKFPEILSEEGRRTAHIPGLHIERSGLVWYDTKAKPHPLPSGDLRSYIPYAVTGTLPGWISRLLHLNNP